MVLKAALIRFLCSLPCSVTIQTFFFPGAHLPPGMNTAFISLQITAEPPTVSIPFESYAAVSATDTVIIADPFIVFAQVHS
jgi:hypothetical protein